MYMSKASMIADDVRNRSGVIARPYQVEAVARTLAGNVMLNLTMGGGKTLCAAMSIRWDVSRVLVSCPLVAKSIWLKELHRGAGVGEVIQLSGKQKLKATRIRIDGGVPTPAGKVSGPVPYGLFLTTHECIGSWADTLPSSGDFDFKGSDAQSDCHIPGQYDVVIVDEAHRYAGLKSKRAFGLKKFSRRADRLVLLTGTPDMGGTHRLWLLLHMLAPHTFHNYYKFLKEFCGAVENPFGGLDPRRGSREDLARLASLMAPWVLTYGDDVIEPYLPRNTSERVVVPLTGEKARKLGAKVASAQKALREFGASRCDHTDRFLPGEVVEARIACADAKVDAVVEMAVELVRSGEHVVVWSWHKEMCHKVAAACGKGGAPSYIICGDTPGPVVDTTIRAWSSTGGVLSATMAKLGEGEDRLVVSRWQLFLEVDWLPQTTRQAMRRIIRLSQSRPTQTRFFELDMPFERSLIDRIMARAEDTDRLFDGNDVAEMGDLFGVLHTGDLDTILQRMSARFG